jgi:outer membrane protein assembly factor BamB
MGPPALEEQKRSSALRTGVHLLGVLVGAGLSALLVGGACIRREPLPTGAKEPTPIAVPSASSRGSAAAIAGARVAVYPNGSVLVAEVAPCRVNVFELDRVRWTREFTSCGGVLDASVASDSTAYVRTARALFAIAPDGRERWRSALDDSVPGTIATPTTMADSRVVIASNTRAIAAFARDGKASWRFSAPSDETIVAPPMGMKTEGIALLTSHAAYALGSDGELRWRAAVSAPPRVP